MEIMNFRDVTPTGNSPKVRTDAPVVNCKVPKFDGDILWELYRKQFEARLSLTSSRFAEI